MSSGTYQKPPLWKGFVTGAIGAMTGSAVSHPLDLIKVRLQVQGEVAAKNTFGSGKIDPRFNYFLQVQSKVGTVGMGKRIFAQEGLPGLFKGVTASLLRQLLYSGTRFGVYDITKDVLGDTPENPLPLYLKVPASLFAGAVGATIGNPGDLTMVRMQADGKLPPELRRGYGNVFNAIFRISREEGIGTLWNGVGATVNRAMIVTVGHLAAYDQIKEFALRSGAKDNLGTHFGSAFGSAFVASVLSHPVDVAKTRLMNMKGEKVYNGTLDCMRKTIVHEGPMALYKGFSATYIRQCPYVVVTWVVREQVKTIL